MGTDAATASRTATSSSNNNNNEPPSEEAFSRLFEEAMKRSSNSSSSSTATPKLEMSRDEQQKFLSAMQSPEFRSLLNDYMTEISDPANRAETEQYLAQLEQEQKVPDDKVLVRPTPGFVVKAKWSEESSSSSAAATSAAKQKLFVNICSSDKLQAPSSTPVRDAPGGKTGTSWHLPYSVGPERYERDHSGASVLTLDVCFHPKTLAFATTQRAYRDMVIKTSLDGVETALQTARNSAKGTSVTVARDYHVLKGVSYKSGDPVTMCLRKPTAAAEPAAKTSSKAPTKPAAKAPTKAETPKEPPIDVVVGKKTQPQSPLSDLTASTAEAPAEAPLMREVSTTKTPATSASAKPAAPVLQPIAHKLVHRGKFELLHHMQATPAGAAPLDKSRPRELVLEMSFPTLASAAAIALDVSEQSVQVSADKYAPLSLDLPFPVLEAKGRATFDKKTRTLRVTLPVQPPPAPKPVAVALQVQDVEDDDNEADEIEDKSADIVENPTIRTSTESALEQQAPAPKTREDDGFAMLRETALMVAHDPLYMPRAVPAAVDSPDATVNETEDAEHLSDLPPLESCSEDEDDDDDLVLVDAPVAQQQTDELAPVAAALPRLTPQVTATTTPSCLSFLVHVPRIDASSVELQVTSATSFTLRFAAAASDSTKQSVDAYELTRDDLEHAVDASTAEFDVASENMVVIFTKSTPTPAAPAPVPAASIAPAVRFQNQLLYELD